MVPVIAVEIETSPTPPNVKPALFVIPPLIVKVFVPETISVLILEAALVVIKPDKVVVPLVLGIHIAPLTFPVMPKLFKKKGSAKL